MNLKILMWQPSKLPGRMQQLNHVIFKLPMTTKLQFLTITHHISSACDCHILDWPNRGCWCRILFSHIIYDRFELFFIIPLVFLFNQFYQRNVVEETFPPLTLSKARVWIFQCNQLNTCKQSMTKINRSEHRKYNTSKKLTKF